MKCHIKIIKFNEEKNYSVDLSNENINAIEVHELDKIQFCFTFVNSVNSINLFIEDCEIPLVRGCEELSYKTALSSFFQEAFGQSIVRLIVNENIYEILFDVKWNKLNQNEIKDMVEYVFTRNSYILNKTLSKSKIEVGCNDNPRAEVETLISVAEILLNNFIRYRDYFRIKSHSKIIKTKMISSNEVSIYEPNDILANLDNLVKTSTQADIVINGQHYKISNVPSINFVETRETKENSILLGGLYSILRKIKTLEKHLENHYKVNPEKDLTSFSMTMQNFTIEPLLGRCKKIIKNCIPLIYFFEKNLGFVYKGELYPIFNSFVTHTNNYKVIFKELKKWYSIGEPTLEHINFMSKICSLSKIYEYFCLFNIFEALEQNGWTTENYLSPFEKTKFFKNNKFLTVYYEKPIQPFHKDCLHGELVDISKKQNTDTNWWYRPDFVIEVNINKEKGYFVLDAKYSNHNNVKSIHMNNLVNKYLLNFKVYDKINKEILNNKLLSVCAIFPRKGSNSSNFSSFWSNQLNNITSFPIVGMIPLSGSSKEFTPFINQAINQGILHINKQH